MQIEDVTVRYVGLLETKPTDQPAQSMLRRTANQCKCCLATAGGSVAVLPWKQLNGRVRP